MLKKTIFLLILLFPLSFFAQKNIIFFKTVKFGNNFISETRSPLTKLEIGYLNKIGSTYYINDELDRPFVESHFGYNLNVFSVTGSDYKFAFCLPGGSITLTDMFEEKTAPVINTDYWFGTQIKFIAYPFKINKFAKNISVNLQPLFHESTHLGDEFVLHGYDEIVDFKRINLSYEAWKLSATLNDPDTLKGNIFSLRVSIQNLWTLKDGYYFTDSVEVKGAEIPRSQKTFEWYFTVNYSRIDGFLCSEKWQNILSCEINNRPQFSYSKNFPEIRAWSYNFYVGWKYKISDKPFRNVGFFIRHYQGISPHGQFRDTRNFRFTGLSISLL